MIKKLGLYTFLVSAVLFTGCSQKNVGFEGQNGTQTQANTLTEKKIAGTEYEATVNNDSMTTNSLTVDDIDYYNSQITLADGTKATIKQVYFAFDKFNLSSEMLIRVKSNAVAFSKIKDTDKIKLDGNCDEWGTDEYNYALGLKRAKSVKDALVAEGINSNKIVLVSLGESNPICSAKTKDCWKLNRRVDNTLLP